ncbi:F510_1955 family glycosylhydrolase [Streptomyces sp. NPDC014779]|uniref:F510_1955 family glycosylhydrolase n=1 Tax=Streptomyces sp. NPDC014779 TaxID=3364911 RepID=UPI0036F7D26D
MTPRRSARSAAAVLALALALTACGTNDPGGSSHSDGADTGAPGHVHGVGVLDGTLYVATHDGLYSPGPEGRPVLVGERRDDFMGFTVTPRGTFLASGHPAPGGDGPADLGLIESTDRGVTWTPRSLEGEVDFHALDTAADATVYGYDATHGRLRVSRDKAAWRDGASLRALDIAVAPPGAPGAGPAGAVLATTEQGVVRSTDGGRSFGAPLSDRVVAHVSWAAPDALFGTAPEGTLLRSADGGVSWTRVSRLPGGPPQALTAVDAHRVLVATRDGVYESADGGRTFARRMAVAPAP